MVDLQNSVEYSSVPAICISHYEYSTSFLVAIFWTMDTGHDVSYDGKGLSRKLILFDPSFSLFLFFFFLLYIISLYRCFFMAILLEILLKRIPFLSILRNVIFFFYCHFLGKLRISFLLLLFFFLSFCLLELYVIFT